MVHQTGTKTRRIARTVALLLLVAPAHIYAQNQNGPSCIGDDLAKCKSTLASRFTLVLGNIDSVIRSWRGVDVSGEPLKGQTTASVILETREDRKADDLTSLTINVNANGTVSTISAGLTKDPATAQTAEEYDKTRVFRLAEVILPKSACPQNSRLEFYRFFNDKVKPTISNLERNQYTTPTSSSDEYTQYSKSIPLCGVYVTYRRKVGRATDFIDRENPLGSFDDTRVIFSGAAI